MNCLRSISTVCGYIALKKDFSYRNRCLNGLSLIASQVGARFRMFEDTGWGDGLVGKSAYESQRTQVWSLSTDIKSRCGFAQVCNPSAVERQEDHWALLTTSLASSSLRQNGRTPSSLLRLSQHTWVYYVPAHIHTELEDKAAWGATVQSRAYAHLIWQ